ncbi:hypothetical protein GPALN_005818 [Globodera pallida]|uniref:DUF19 domain-containing protein n=1 Tax=Globodera pallida TaxID=36090 RepID=A0A183BRJ7_GLOPA|nr:hypothetical protein GPALN_005818 [Globodera pallida]
MIAHILLICFLHSAYAAETKNAYEAYGGEEHRQCTCAEQTECFEELKNNVAKCFDVVYGSVYNEIKSYADPNKLRQCFVEYEDKVLKLMGCTDQKLIKKESCLADKKYVKIRGDFVAAYSKVAHEHVESRMNHLYGLDKKNPIVQLDQKWHNNAMECGINQLTAMESCLTKKSCGPKAAEKELKSVFSACYKEFKVVDVHRKRCECLTKNGVGNNYSGYCEKANMAKNKHLRRLWELEYPEDDWSA